MRIVACTIRQHSLTAGQRREIANMIQRHYRHHLAEPARVVTVWLEVPAEQAFTAGTRSSMTWIMGEVSEHQDQTARENALHAISQDWATITGTRSHDLMLTLADSSTFHRYLALTRNRVAPPHQPWIAARTGIRLALSAATERTLTTSLNY